MKFAMSDPKLESQITLNIRLADTILFTLCIITLTKEQLVPVWRANNE